MEKNIHFADTPICQSCGMPLAAEEMYGTEDGGGKSGEYCLYCMKDGRFTADMTMDEMIEFCIPHMEAAHPEMSAAGAREMMQKVLPGLKRWQTN